MNKKLIMLVCLLFSSVVYGTTFTNIYDVAKPANSDNPSSAAAEMRRIKAALKERLDVDHYFEYTGTECSDVKIGEHRKLTLNYITAAELAALTSSKSYVYVYGRELYFKDVGGATDANVVQISKKGYLNLDDSILSNATYLKARNAADTGTVDLIKAATVDGNEGAVLPNFTYLTTNTAPTESNQVVCKQYVDDSTTTFGTLASGSVTFDNVSDAVATDGFLTILLDVSTGGFSAFTLYADADNPPTTVVANEGTSYNYWPPKKTITVPIKSEWRWKLSRTTGTAGTATYRWMPLE